MSNAVGLPELLDIVGYNYQESRYAEDHQEYPKRFICGSENGDQYSNWTVVRDNEYVAGQFLWTGIDYLGEANRWPNRANGAGLLDLCGFKKPDAWYRQSLWSDKPMVYICASQSRGAGRGRFRGFRGLRGEERWNWPDGSTVNVTCCTNCPEVRLTLNDKEVATGRPAETVNGALTWQVPYEPGVLKAVGLKDGRPASEFSLKTAGPVKRIKLVPLMDIGGSPNVMQVEFEIVDDHGVRVPDASQEITFDLTGATLLGVGNADLNSSDDCTDRMHKAYGGRGLLILRVNPIEARVNLVARAEGLEQDSIDFHIDY
jgi:beta-galactosidase